MKPEMEASILINEGHGFATDFVKSISFVNGRNYIQKQPVVKDLAIQTDNMDLKMVITNLVQARLDRILSFDSKNLQEKIAKMEEECQNLRKRESVLQGRLAQLETDVKKRHLVHRNHLEPCKTNQYQDDSCLQRTESESGKSTVEYHLDVQSAEMDMTHPLIPIKQRRELPTQKLHPMRNIADYTTKNIIKLKTSTACVVPDISDTVQKLEHSSVRNSCSECVDMFVTRSPNISVPAIKQQFQHPLQHSQSLGNGQTKIRPEDEGPPPNLYLLEYKPLSNFSAKNRMSTKQTQNDSTLYSRQKQQHVPWLKGSQRVQLEQRMTQALHHQRMQLQQQISHSQHAQHMQPEQKAQYLQHVQYEQRDPHLKQPKLTPLRQQPPYPRTHKTQSQYPEKVQSQSSAPRPIHNPTISSQSTARQKETLYCIPLPMLTAKISSDEKNIILTWDCYNRSKTFQCNVDVYLIFAFHTLNLNNPPPDNVAAWKRIGSTKAKQLPVIYTLTQSFDGHSYFFAVLPVDNHGSLGELSNPCALKVVL